jgi:hypothetical protein
LEITADVFDEDDVVLGVRLKARHVGRVPLDDERALVVFRVAPVVAGERPRHELLRRPCRRRAACGNDDARSSESERAREAKGAADVRGHGANLRVVEGDLPRECGT